MKQIIINKELVTINSKKIAHISLRVLSIYIFIQALLISSQIISLSIYNSLIFPNYNEGIEITSLDLILASIVPVVLLILLSFILWFFADRISNYLLLPNVTDDKLDTTISLDEVQYIAFSIIGVVILANTLPEIFYWIPSMVNINELYPGIASTQYKTDLILSIIGYVVKLLIGLVLIFGSKGLTGMLNKVRGLGK